MTAVKVYERSFKKISTEMAVYEPAAENSVRPIFRGIFLIYDQRAKL